MKTLWIITGNMNAGGAESLIMELLRFKKANFQIRLIIHSDCNNYNGIYDREIESLNIPVSHLSSVGSIGILRYRKEFQNLVQAIGKPDIIHSHLNAVGGFIAWVAASCGIVHRIVHCHADITYRGSFIKRIKSEFVLSIMKWFVNRYGTDFWACSEAAAKRLFYKDKRTVIIPNIIDVQKYLNTDKKHKKEREKLKIDNKVILIGAVGRIARIKNYEVILKAVKLLKEKEYNIRFICYGRPMDEAYYQELLQLSEQLGICNLINFLGNCQTVYDSIAAFDIFVMPSITEGFGIAALEAQAAGIPCIVSTGIPTEVDMELGLIKKIRPDDIEGWSKAILNFRPNIPSMEIIKKCISEKGYDSVTECEKIYKRYSDIAEGKTK